MGIDTVAVTELFARHRDKSGRVDTSALASELGKAYADPAGVLEQFLGLPDTGDWRYYEFDIMRELAEQGQLSRDEAWGFLEKMCLLWARLDADEFYDTIYAMACSEKTAPVLLEFMETHLLKKQDVRDWRWLTFTAVGEVAQRKTADIPQSLMQMLRSEAEKEEDHQRRRQLTEYLYFPEIQEIYATGKVGGCDCPGFIMEGSAAI